MDKYVTRLSDQIGKRLIEVLEKNINVKELLFDDDTRIIIEGSTWTTECGSLGILSCREEKV